MGVVIAVAVVAGLLSGSVSGVTAYAIARKSDTRVITSQPSEPLGVPAAANRAPK